MTPKAKKVTIKITQIMHYQKEDTGCGGDYYDIELQDSEGKVIATFGDYYHDKGEEKAEGFILGVECALGVTVNLVKKYVADRD